MNISQTRWSKLKTEFFSVLYLCIVQTWLNFTFPTFIELGVPFCVGISIVAILWYIFSFSQADIYLTPLMLEVFNDVQEEHRETMRNILRAALFVFAHILFLYIWRHDYYRMSSFYYPLYYLHFVIAYTLMIRAVTRA